MAKPYLVSQSIEHPEKNRCVDIVQQHDGKYRFQEWRRDIEDTSGWILLFDSQPIALGTSCPDYLVHDQTKIADIERILSVLGSDRMKRANQRWRYGEWFLRAGNLYWNNDSGEVEELE